MTMEVFTKIVNFMTPGACVLIGRGHIKCIIPLKIFFWGHYFSH